MSIQQLPEDVVAQIKSSTAITSLNGVICGLVKNSLDADATKLTISVDYAKGNCSVEDNGRGILPAEFTTSGGLGKLHFTSHFPAQSDCYGSSGTFLASVAALSLLSITSRHQGHHSHNTLHIHNSKVLARYTPSPPEQRLPNFSHGTQAVVRDLFGSMPVRVKQRAAVVDKSNTAKDWEHLKFSIVALLLAWPGSVSISLRDSSGHQACIRNGGAVTRDMTDNARRSILSTRVSGLFCQAGLSDETPPGTWITLKASAGQLSITGAVCVIPVATKRMQFINIGVEPVPNERGSNVLHEEINRLFASSSFGIQEGSSSVDSERKIRNGQTDRHGTDGYPDQELRGRKGVDKWPMFHIRIDLGGNEQQVSRPDLDEVFDERHNRLQSIVDLLRAMFYEFLKRYHFRPVYNKLRKRRSPTRSNSSSNSRPVSRQDTLDLPSRPVSSSDARSQTADHHGVGDLATSQLRLPIDHEQTFNRESPYDQWSKVKFGRPALTGAKQGDFVDDTACTHVENIPVSTEPQNRALFSSQGELLAISLPDIGEPSEVSKPTGRRNVDTGYDDEFVSDEERIEWVNPVTKRKSIVNARTGCVIEPPARTGAGQSNALNDFWASPAERLRSQAPSVQEEVSPWLDNLLSSWSNPVFHATEPPISALSDEAKLLDSMNSCARNGHAYLSNIGFNIATRVSKDDLRTAEVIAQVDKKFILAKVCLKPLRADAESPVGQPSLLIMIDQHAADERCGIEQMMAEYFAPGVPGPARTELLAKELQYEISAQERQLFERHAPYFEHWGIVYRLTGTLPQLEWQTVRLPSLLMVSTLPPSIYERCRTEPRLLIDLLRKEVWSLDESSRGSVVQSPNTAVSPEDTANEREFHWISRFHGCPQGILDLMNSRACRSAIMFNDALSADECRELLRRLADCAFPFQCAHGRPSMVPLVDMGNHSISANDGGSDIKFVKQFRRWKGTTKSCG